MRKKKTSRQTILPLILSALLIIGGVCLMIPGSRRKSAETGEVFRIHLNRQPQNSAFDFETGQRYIGNMLLDLGIRLFPGDGLIWKDIPVTPDFDLGAAADKSLTLKTAESFRLIRDGIPVPVEMHGSGTTVGEVLRSLGMIPSKSMLVLPDEETAFEPGMTIEMLSLRPLTISANGRVIEVVSAGGTVGEALARAGFPLQGSDVSIPAASEPLPEDGRILIVPVSDAFEMDASIEAYNIEWQADADLPLDTVKVLRKGTAGLKGTMKHTRMENRSVVREETSEERTLAEPSDQLSAYGTKVEIRTLDTPNGPIEYYRSLPVYATSYSPCRSGTSACVNGTASGRKLEKGIIAVTPAMYRLIGGATVYVPDYGIAVIGDTGGGVSGKTWIDLAYSDDDYVARSGDTVMYFLTPVPTDLVWVLQ